MTMEKREALVNYCLQFMRVWLPKTRGSAFTADHFGVVALERLNLLEAPDMRLLGAVFQRALRAKLIEPVTVNGVRATVLTRSRHRSPLWMAA